MPERAGIRQENDTALNVLSLQETKMELQNFIAFVQYLFAFVIIGLALVISIDILVKVVVLFAFASFVDYCIDETNKHIINMEKQKEAVFENA